MKLNEMGGDHPEKQTYQSRFQDAARKITDPEEFYQQIIIPSNLFEAAYELFPLYNSSQSIDAAEWIMQQIENNVFEDSNNPNWINMQDEIYDKIIAGLT